MVKRLLLVILVLISSLSADPQKERFHWLQDKNYLNGIMYLNGSKGASLIKKQISNCPYDKCKILNMGKKGKGPVSILLVKKPNYKKALMLLQKSSNAGNAYASDQIILFLSRRLPYKTKHQMEYMLNQLKKDTGLSYDDYVRIFKNAARNGYFNGGCSSSYFAGEMLSYGYLYTKIDKKMAKQAYKQAYHSCPNNNMYKMLSGTKMR